MGSYGQNYANRRYWDALQRGEPSDRVGALERNGMPKPPSFQSQKYRHRHSKPVQLSKLMGRPNYPEGRVVFSPFVTTGDFAWMGECNRGHE